MSTHTHGQLLPQKLLLPEDEEIPEITTTDIAVTVTDGTDPVSNVDVILEDAEEQQYTGKTGDQGGCNIKNVPLGTYSVVASATGYQDYEGTLIVAEDTTSLSITLSQS